MLSVRYNGTFFPVTTALDWLDVNDKFDEQGILRKKTHYYVDGKETPHISINKYSDFHGLKHHVCPSFNKDEDFSASP